MMMMDYYEQEAAEKAAQSAAATAAVEAGPRRLAAARDVVMQASSFAALVEATVCTGMADENICRLAALRSMFLQHGADLDLTAYATPQQAWKLTTFFATCAEELDERVAGIAIAAAEMLCRSYAADRPVDSDDEVLS